MFASFRLAMTWIHTWIGLVAGYLLMTIFVFGTLSVFDREIDRWAIPETRFAAQPMPSWSEVLEPAVARLGKTRVTQIGAFRTQRDPIVTLYIDDARESTETVIDARTGVPIPPNAFALGTHFFYPMHIHLHLGEVANVGYWLVGFAALGMLLALVTGVVIHRRLFAELFTFRPWKARQRATLDLHNLTGVLALPFHFVFAFTGLVIFAGIYLPVSSTVLAPLSAAHERNEQAARGYALEPAGRAAPLASVDAMIAEAERRWSGDARDVGYVVVRFPGDTNASVSVYRAGRDRVTMFGAGVHFDGTTGKVIAEDPPPSAVAAVVGFLTAVHLQPFEQWTLRWLYLVGGLMGSVCIATGFVFFVEKRRRKQPHTARWADAIAVATVTGTLVAVLALLVANRALPAGLAARVPSQQGIFWAAWLSTFVHAAFRKTSAWRDQCWAIAVLALAAMLLNAITTGDHLVRTLFVQRYWPVACVDLALLVTALVATASARRLGRR